MATIVSTSSTIGLYLNSFASQNPVTVTKNGTLAPSGTGAVGIFGSGTATAWTIFNYGVVAAAGSSSVGVYLRDGGAITNHSGGTISADTSSGEGIILYGAGTITNQSGGLISGADGIFARYAAATVTNVGVIDGNSASGDGILLDTGGTITNQSGGLISAYIGVFARTIAATVVNAGTIDGNITYGPAVVLLAGGVMTNMSTGTIAGVDGLYAANATATVTNAGSIYGSYNGVVMRAGGTLTNTAGTIKGFYYGVITNGTNAATITNEADIVGRARAGIGAFGGGTITNTSVGTVAGYDFGINANNDSVVIVNQGTITASSTVNHYGTNTSGSTPVTYGVIGDAGVALFAGGTVENSASANIAGHHYGVILTDGGTVSNAASGTIHSADWGVVATSDPASVANQGTITGTYEIGVYLLAGGTVSNSGSGVITGGYFGVQITGAAAMLSNSGSISNTVVVINSSKKDGAGVDLNDGGTVINSSGGTIRSTWKGVAIGGISNASGGTVLNQGLITASDTYGDGAAVWIHGPGTISNAASGTIAGGAFGVVEYFQTTLTNLGTITGTEFAIDGSAGYANRVIDAPGAVFSGTVSGGNTIGSTVVSTLELASGASAGTLSGLGTQFVDFGQVTIDAGSAWKLTGANTVASGVTVTDSGTLTNTGTLLNSGVISGNLSLSSGASVTNQSGGTIIGLNGVYAPFGALAVVNAGSILGNASLGTGVNLQASGSVTNQSGGVITGGIGIIAASGTVNNAGSIGGNIAFNFGIQFLTGGSVSNQTSGTISGYDGVFAGDMITTVVNAGHITGNATAGSGLYLTGGGRVTNQTGGTISGDRGVTIDHGGTVVNAGVISGSAAAVAFQAGFANRVVIDPGAVFSGTVNGANTIGATAVSTLELASGAGVGTLTGLGSKYVNFAQLTVDAGAAWTVNALTIGAGLTFTNAGTLTSDATLTAGGLFTNASGGTIVGSGLAAVRGATGAVVTVVNAGLIDPATYGVYLPAGGMVTNVLGGTIIGTLDGIKVKSGAGTIANTGAISGNVTSASGSGVYLGAGGVITNASGGTITGYDAIKVATIAATVINNGSIDGGTTNQGAGINLQAGGTVTNLSRSTISGYGGGILIGTVAGTVVNAGSIAASSFSAIDLEEGGQVTNQSGGVITGSAYASGVEIVDQPGTLINDGRIAAGFQYAVWLENGGVVTNQTGGTIIGYAGAIAPADGVGISSAPGTVINYGSIASTGASAVYVFEGQVSNHHGGTITGSYAGVSLGSGATLVNAGFIYGAGSTLVGGFVTLAGALVTGYGYIANQSGGTITGYNGVVGGPNIETPALTIVNAGSIGGNTTAGFGVDFRSGGDIANQSGGTVSGAIGIYGHGAASTVVNAGSIHGTTDAVLLHAGYTNRVVIDPGAVFSGAVNGGNTLGATAASTLEFASGASAGTLSGLGSKYINFAQITIDSGATWALSGTNSLASLQTLTNAGTLDVPGTGLSDTGPIANNGVMEATSGTLELGGSVSGTGTLEAGSGTTLRLDQAVSSGQSIAFASGTPETLILQAPGAGLANAITGFTLGDRIELGAGETITSASFTSARTIQVITTTGTYVLSNVTAAAGGVPNLTIGTDGTTGDMYLEGSAPRTFAWTGGSSNNLGTAANWNDLTDARNPSSVAPGVADTVQFLASGGVVTGSSSVNIAQFGSGGLWSFGAGASLSVASGITVGTGLVAVGAGGSIASQGTTDTISGSSGQAGTVLVSGTGATWHSGGALLIGNTGLGDLSVTGDGTVIAAGATIANTSTASGSSVNVTGTGSDWTVSGALLVGNAGAGSLNITAGGTVSATSLDAGVISSGSIEGTGQISLSGPGSDLAISGNAIIGDAGSANLSILDGATLSAANLTIGSQGSGSGSALVSDTGSVLHLTGTLNVGTPLGVGELTIGPSATIIASKVVLNGEIVDEGGLLDPNEIDFTPGNGFVGFGTVGGLTDLIVNTGTIEAAAGSKPTQKTLTVEGTVSGVGGLLQIDAGSTMVVTGPVRSGQTIAFGGTSAALVLGDAGGFAGTVTTFHVGDELIVSGTSVVAESFVNNVLTLFASGTTVLGTVTFAPGAVSGGYLSLDGSGGVTSVACFAAGTRIGTDRGEVRVEDLTAGDLVRTVLGDALAPVVWVGHRTVDCARHPKPEAVWPVRVRAHAFGANVPVRDVYLSPDHAVYLNEVLIPVKHLVNGSSVAQVPTDTVTYYHVELPAHDVVLAENLPAESYLETGDRANFANAGAVVRQFPDFSARAWEALGCAPLVVTGKELETAKASIRERAATQSAA